MSSKWDGSWQNDPLDLRCIRLDAELEALADAKRKRESSPRRLPRFFEPHSLTELAQHCKEGDSWSFYCSRKLTNKKNLKEQYDKYLPCDIIRKADGLIVDNTCSCIQQARERIITEHGGRFEDYDVYALTSSPATIQKVEI